jgi:HEAT repeat protein
MMREALHKTFQDRSSLCNLCVLGVSVVKAFSAKTHHRGTENTEVAQRRSAKARVASASFALLVAMCFPGGELALTSSARAGQERKLDNKAEEAFRFARELFDEEKWSDAVVKFEEFLAVYPHDKNVPAAHYWLALTLKKQGKYGEADERLARLLSEFPNSNWTNDARAMRVEIAGLTSNVNAVIQSASDENESVKLTALQSLLRLDPPRALSLIADVLRPDSTASLKLKMSVVTLLGRGGGKAALPMLAQVINRPAATELRVAGVHALVQIDDPSVFDALKTAANSDDRRVVHAAVLAIGQLRGEQPRAYIVELARTANGPSMAREQSILLLGQQSTESDVDELLKIYEGNTDLKTRKQTILALCLSRSPRADAKLSEIARQQGASTELRREAILALGQRGESQSLGILIQLYDEENGEAVKKSIILSLGQTGEKSATRKLMVIAKSDPSPRLRQLAVLSLQRSSDPEVRKFLQEMNRTGSDGKE